MPDDFVIELPDDWQAAKEQLVDDMLMLWESALERGTDLGPHEICKNCPTELANEVEDAIRMLKQFRRDFEKDPVAFSASGFQVDGYQGKTIVEEGGQGIVLRAWDSRLSREVAVKLPKNHLDSSGVSWKRIERESHLASQLEHPGVIPIHHAGRTSEGVPYYAMRLMRKERTLLDVIQALEREPRNSDYSVKFRGLLRDFVSICRTVEYAHSKGIVHRDLKPQNILVGEYGEVFVADFGIAKEMSDADTPIPQSEESEHGPSVELNTLGPLGSPAYMSPEQAKDASGVEPSSDVYSLGATLYHILTGKPPKSITRDHMIRTTETAAGAATESQRRSDTPRHIDPSVPAALEAICLKAMEVDSADRYQTAKALADDIENWLADQPVGAWREPWSVKLARWLKNHRTLVTTAAVATVIIMVGLAISSLLLGWEKTKLEQSNAALRKVSYLNAYSAAVRRWQDRRFQDADEKLDECDPGMRGFEWHWLKQKCNPSISTEIPGMRSVWRFALNDDQTKIAALGSAENSYSDRTNSAKRICILERKSGKILNVIDRCNSVSELIEHPDGQGLIEEFSLNALFPDACKTELGWLIAEPKWESNQGKQTPHLEFVTRAQGDGQQTTDPVRGPELRFQSSNVRISPNGKYAWVGAAREKPNNSAVIYRTNDGQIAATLQGHTQAITTVRFSSNGKLVVTGSLDGTARVWDTESGQELVTLQGHTSKVTCVTVAPTGEYAATYGHDHTIRVWNLTDPWKGQLINTMPARNPVYHLTFQGLTLLSVGDDGLRQWPLQDPQVKYLPSVRNLYVASVEIATKGDLFATVHRDYASTEVHLRSIASGETKLVVETASLGENDFTSTVAAAISQDETMLAIEADDGLQRIGIEDGEVHWTTAGLGGPIEFTPDGKKILAVRKERSFADVLRSIDGVERIQPEQTRQLVKEMLDAKFYDADFPAGNERLEIHLKDNEVLLNQIKSLANYAVAIVDANTGTVEEVFGEFTSNLAVSGDGRLVATLGNGVLKIRDLASLEAIKEFPQRSDAKVRSFAFDASGERLAVAVYPSGNGRSAIEIYDTKAWILLTSLAAQDEPVIALAFSADGQRLASSRGNLVDLWETESWELLWTFQDAMRKVFRLAFSDSGNQLFVTTGVDERYPGRLKNFQIWEVVRNE